MNAQRAPLEEYERVIRRHVADLARAAGVPAYLLATEDDTEDDEDQQDEGGTSRTGDSADSNPLHG